MCLTWFIPVGSWFITMSWLFPMQWLITHRALPLLALMSFSVSLFISKSDETGQMLSPVNPPEKIYLNPATKVKHVQGYENDSLDQIKLGLGIRSEIIQLVQGQCERLIRYNAGTDSFIAFCILQYIFN